MSKSFVSMGGLLIVLVLMLAVNVLASASLRSLRIDLTANELYTLSEGSKRVLEKLDEPVTLRLYFSKKLAADYPPLPAYAQRVEELLLEYVSHSGGKLTLESFDPEPFTEIEDRAVQLGLQGIPLPTGEQLYFGLAGNNSIGDEEVIPFFNPEKEAFLEYDLTKLVYGLANPVRPVVGVLSSLPIEGAAPNPLQPMRQPPQPWFVMDQVRQLFETRSIQPGTTEIPEEVGVLMIVHPKNLAPGTLYAIDQFVLRGGRVLAFVDPYCDADVPPQDPNNPMAAMMAPRNSSLDPLLGAWGVQLAPDKLAGDRKQALSVRANNRGQEQVVRYVVWLGLTGESFNGDEVVSSSLGTIRTSTAGLLEPTAGAGTEFIPLLRTSTDSMEINTSTIQFQPDPTAMLADFFPSGNELVVAARISGPASSAFPDGRPAPADPEAEEPADEPEHLSASQGPISVIVVADADLLQDQWWVELANFGGQRIGFKNADNGDLVTNSLDYLTGSTDLISLRGRGGSTYPFVVVEELQRKAEEAFRAEEQRLLDELEKAEQRLGELQAKREGTSTVLLSAEQQSEIARLRDEQVKTRANLRSVRRNLKKDIENLGTRLKWLNIGAIPLLVGLFAVGMGAWKSGRGKRA